MVKLAKHELGLLAKNRAINNYLNMSREKLLSILDEYDRIIENLSKKWTRENHKNAESFIQ